MSTDGQRLFFGTPDALVPEDTNGETGCPLDLSFMKWTRSALTEVNMYACNDVYEWHDGTVSLVSSGTGTESARLIGSDTSGENVFFFTRQSLVGWDIDLSVDIYNARIGGGFPEPPATGAPCEGDACRGAGTGPADIPGAGSRALVHRGNTPPQPNTCGRFNKKAKRKLNVARKAAKRGQAKRAQGLRKQARNLNRRAKRCNRRQAS